MEKHLQKETKPNIGGQAVIEGVFLRAPWGYSLAVRRPDGNIETLKEKYEPLTKRYKILGLPIIRGCISLFEQLVLGIKMLNKSAEIALKEEDEPPKWLKKVCDFISYKFDISKEKVDSIFYKSFEVIMTILAFVIAIAVFMVLPHFFGQITVGNEKSHPILFNVIAGVVRVILFVGYIKLISYSKDIKRVFEYHGAEHKVVFAYENEGEVNVANAKKYQTAHPRCGTNFIFIVILVSIFIFSFATQFIIWLCPNFVDFPLILRKIIIIFAHLFLLPLVAGVSYEVMKFSAKHENTWWSKIINAPGMFFQNLTTAEPDEEQLEVAIASLKTLLSIKE